MEIDTIMSCPLFNGIGESELIDLLDCLNVSRRTCNRDEYVFMAEDKVTYVGIVLSGVVHIIQEDFWGNRVILGYVEPGGMFGEAFSCADTERFPVSVVAAERSELMLLDYRRIVVTCSSACAFHTQLLLNMLRTLAEKNIQLTRKIEHISKRTTREKLLSFLSAQAAKDAQSDENRQSKDGENVNAVEIPFNRQELADYLCVDRSALSRELAQMQKDGLLVYSKNRFELLRN